MDFNMQAANWDNERRTKRAKIIADNGHLCIVELVEDDGSFHKLERDFNGHNGFNQFKLRNMLEDVGFKSVKTNVFYNDIKINEDLEINYSLFLMLGQR